MKKSTIVTTLLMSILCFPSVAQRVSLNDLNRFDKIIIEGNVSEVNVNSSHGDPAIIIEGASEEEVSVKTEAGVSYLRIKNNANVLVSIFNSDLRRIEGSRVMNITGAKVIGDDGKYLVMSQAEHSDNFIADHDLHHDFDLDLDIDFEDLAVDLGLEMEELCKNLDFEWKEHRVELKEELKQVELELKQAAQELKQEMKRLKEQF